MKKCNVFVQKIEENKEKISEYISLYISGYLKKLDISAIHICDIYSCCSIFLLIEFERNPVSIQLFNIIYL